MASILKCKQYDMLNLKLKKGQIYYCTDTSFLYKDYGASTSNRIRLNAKILSSEYERLEKIIPSMNKMYYVIATNNLYLYNGKWTFIAGDSKEYNSYSYSNGTLTPVNNVDEYITSKKTGDVIIDNNGLLGDGSVVIRDSDRIVKGLLEVDGMYNRLNIKSYLSNGINLIPNANKNYNDYGMKTGTLQLNMTLNDNESKGIASYHGDWYNYGNQYIISKNDLMNNVYPNEITSKNINKTFIEFYYKYIETDKLTNEEKENLYKCYLTIKLNSINDPDNPNIDMNVLVINADDNSSVVKDDQGTPIFTKATVNMQYDLSTGIDETISATFTRENFEEVTTININNDYELIDEFKNINEIIDVIPESNVSLYSNSTGVVNTLFIENIPLYKINGPESYIVNNDGNVEMENTQSVIMTLKIIEKHIISNDDKIIATDLSHEVEFFDFYENGENNETSTNVILNNIKDDEHANDINLSSTIIKNWNKSKVITANDLYLLLNGMLAIEDLL